MARIAAGLFVALTIAGCQPSDARSSAGLASGAGAFGGTADDVRPGRVTARLEQLLWDQRAPAYIRGDLWHLVRTSYDRRQYQPYWVGAGAPGRAAALVTAVCSAEEEGLRSGDYQIERLAAGLELLRRSRTAGQLGELDLLLTGTMFAYGEDLLLGKVAPGTVAPEWDAAASRAAAERLLQETLAGTVSLDSALVALRPRSAAYADLIEALRPLRAADAAGGWAEIPDDEVLRRGSRGPAVDALRRRLAATGELAPRDSLRGRAFDAALAGAVARFQARHGLPADGVAGRETIAAMNVPAAVRIAQIEANLERYRWIPENLLTRYAIFDVPAARLAVVAGDTTVRMTAHIGDGVRRVMAPVLADTIAAVVVQPSWTVPPDIVRSVVIPAARADPGFPARAGLEALREVNGRLTRMDAVDWRSDSLAEPPHVVRQLPGERNVLGPIALSLAHHGTLLVQGPARSAEPRLSEARGARFIVVDRPLELAALAAGRPPAALQAAIDVRPRTTLELAAALPLFVFDPTARREGDQIRFTAAVPARDQAIANALGPGSPQPAERCEALALAAASAVLSAP